MAARPVKLNMKGPWAREGWARSVIRDLRDAKAGRVRLMPCVVALREPGPHELAPVGPAPPPITPKMSRLVLAKSRAMGRVAGRILDAELAALFAPDRVGGTDPT